MSARNVPRTTLPIVIVPGLHGSEAGHWQSQWQAQLPTARRIQVGDWHQADLDRWRRGIRTALGNSAAPALLVAHSFGCLASAVVAAEQPERIAGLFLVAPADPDKFGVRSALPREHLRPSTTLVGSRNDPWMTESKSRELARKIGATYLDAGAAGHINVTSGAGIWPQGWRWYQQFAATLEQSEPLRHTG